ncbi:MAG TPA: endonuclease/exonuclease/phosphatase family protein [Actinomycetota bacterium]|nr:endonuclease/exonuclease/phosphatase family protein [Actinomycetota bacterium]
MLTLNLWGRRGSWEDRRRVLVDGLRDVRPDLVAFQEAIVTADYDQPLDLLGDGFHFAHQKNRDPDGQGVSIASRWPIDGVDELDLHVTPRTADFACTTLVADVRSPVARMLFANHFPSWQPRFEAERERQAVIAARFLEERVEDDRPHVVVAGDLDADPDAASIRFWTGRLSLEGMSVCYRDAWESAHHGEPGQTFSPTNPLVEDHDWPFRRIDYILVRCGLHGGPTLAIVGCERVFDEPSAGVWASDHFGVRADLALPGDRSRKSL